MDVEDPDAAVALPPPRKKQGVVYKVVLTGGIVYLPPEPSQLLCGCLIPRENQDHVPGRPLVSLD